MNTSEIKARIYDLLVIIEQAKHEIEVLQSELQKSNTQEPEPAKEAS